MNERFSLDIATPTVMGGGGSILVYVVIDPLLKSTQRYTKCSVSSYTASVQITTTVFGCEIPEFRFQPIIDQPISCKCSRF